MIHNRTDVIKFDRKQIEAMIEQHIRKNCEDIPIGDRDVRIMFNNNRTVDIKFNEVKVTVKDS